MQKKNIEHKSIIKIKNSIIDSGKNKQNINFPNTATTNQGIKKTAIKLVKKEPIILVNTQTSNTQKYFYFGECGFFMINIVQYLDEILRFNNEKIEMFIMPDYVELYKSVFGNRIKTIPFQYSEKRLHINSELDRKLKNSVNKTKNIEEYILKYYPNSFIEHRSKVLLQKDYLRMPFESKRLAEENTVLIFPRNRMSDKYRNMDINLFNSLVNLIPKSNKIYIIGHPNETLQVPNFKKITDFTSYINYFKTCKLFITADSGLKDYALNSGCKYIIMYTSRDNINNSIGIPIDKYHYTYNPFGAKIMIIRSLEFKNEMENIKKFITYQEKPLEFSRNYYVYYKTKELPKYKLFTENNIYIVHNTTDDIIDYAIIDYDKTILNELFKKKVSKISVLIKDNKLRENFYHICGSTLYTVELYCIDDDIHNFILCNNQYINNISIITKNELFNRNLFFMYGRVIHYGNYELNRNEKYLIKSAILKSSSLYTIISKEAYLLNNFIKKITSPICDKNIKLHEEKEVIGGLTKNIRLLYK